MIDDTHRTELLEAMPAEKAKEKKARTWRGLAYSLFGAALAFGGLYAAIRFIDGGGEISKWPVILIGGIVAGGILLVFYGGHIASNELSSSFFKDVSSSIRSVWRRNGDTDGA